MSNEAAVAVQEREADDKQQQIPILINNKPYKAPTTPMTVAQIKALASLPLDFNCYRVVHNKNIGPLPNEDQIDLLPGDRFVILRGEDPS